MAHANYTAAALSNIGRKRKNNEDAVLSLPEYGVFCVADGILYTPPLDADILPGITRQQIIKGAQELGIIVKEDYIQPEFLKRASESFLTSSVRGVVPISSIDDYRFVVIGEMTKKLLNKYSEMSNDYINKLKL